MGCLPLPAACAALAAILLYASTLDNPFVYDDFRLIVENPWLQGTPDVRGALLRDITRPLVSLSYVADTFVWGARPFGYHLTNVLLHAINVVLVFWVAFFAAEDWRRRGGGTYGIGPSPGVVATVTSVLAAVHPVMTQAVGYITGRSELLYGLFFLSSLLAARRWMRTGRGRIVVVGCWILSLLAKESAAMLPLVLWCYDAWLMDDHAAATWRRVKALYVPLGVTVLILAAARLAVLSALEYPDGSGPDWRYALVSLDAFWRYLALYVWPIGQSIMHTLPPVSGVTPRVIVNLVGVVALVVVVWRLRLFQAPISLGLVMSAAMLVPSTALFSVGVGEPMAEHRAYLSAMAFFLACGTVAGVAWDLVRTTGRGTLAMAALGAACAAQLAGLTIIRNEVWGSTVALAREAVAYSPNHWMTRLFLGETLRQTGRCGEAITEYRTVIVMRPRDTFAYTKEVSCLLQTGQVHEAEHVLRELRAVDPQSQEAAMGLALMAVARGQTDESRSYFTEVLARDARRADARPIPGTPRRLARRTVAGRTVRHCALVGGSRRRGRTSGRPCGVSLSPSGGNLKISLAVSISVGLIRSGTPATAGRATPKTPSNHRVPVT